MAEEEVRSEQLQALMSRLGIRIVHTELLDRALTHASIAAESLEPVFDYEALEFLGDAVLGLAVAHHLLQHKPNSTPGEYSRIRAALVNRRTLAELASKLDIAPNIRLGKGEEQSGGRTRSALLADCVEALSGAIYLDQGWESARDFVIHVTHEEFEEALTQDVQLDHKSRLQHYCQAERMPLPRFELVRSDGPDHRKQFEVEVYLRDQAFGRGGGLSKKEAEQNAARVALERVGVYIK